MLIWCKCLINTNVHVDLLFMCYWFSVWGLVDAPNLLQLVAIFRHQLKINVSSTSSYIIEQGLWFCRFCVDKVLMFFCIYVILIFFWQNVHFMLMPNKCRFLVDFLFIFCWWNVDFLGKCSFYIFFVDVPFWQGARMFLKSVIYVIAKLYCIVLKKIYPCIVKSFKLILWK